ncbi:carbon storage regulator [bacterium]|nr:carbon storage regulator [bacterium]
MLVITRRQTEAVVVGRIEDSEQLLKVVVLEIRGGSVRLGFQADRAIPVHRFEIWSRLQDEATELGSHE